MCMGGGGNPGTRMVLGDGVGTMCQEQSSQWGGPLAKIKREPNSEEATQTTGSEPSGPFSGPWAAPGEMASAVHHGAGADPTPNTGSWSLPCFGGGEWRWVGIFLEIERRPKGRALITSPLF